MAAKFNLTAQINLRAPSNLKPVVSDIKRQLGSITADVNIKVDNRALKSIDTATNRLTAMNKVLSDVRNNTLSLNNSLRDLSSSLGSVKTSGSSASSGLKNTSDSAEKVSKNVKVARTEMEEFGKQSALAIRRFLAFSAPTAIIFGLTNAITQAFKAFISFDKELIRLQQVTGAGAIGISALESEVTRLSTTLGVSSESLMTVATTLAQAGLNAAETRTALEALAKTELSPSFENLAKTTEGAIAILRQFGLEASDLEAALGSVKAVSAAFAVESGDIIAAIQRTGGVFASASKGVTEGKDALNEFIAIFTSVRQTTRESAETIATGLRTIFTRIQRAKTIEQLKEFGVSLQDLEGKFVGPFEAVKRLSEALNQLDPRDIRFSTIVEELGGFRQIGKVIPLIQQFGVAQQALGVAQKGQNSLTDDQIVAQKSLANQLVKVREQFLALIREVGKSAVFQGFFKIVTGLASGLIGLANAFKPILPILAIMATIKGVSVIGQFATGFFGGLKKGGGAAGSGSNLGSTISGAKEKERAEATSRAADAIRSNTDALKTLTTAVSSLDNTIKSKGSTTLASGGRVYAFNRGGVVPGYGRGDRVPALLEPGEVVMSNRSVNRYGRGNLVRMNKYAQGGPTQIRALEKRQGETTIKESYRLPYIQPEDVITGTINREDIEFDENSKIVNWKKLVKEADIEYQRLKKQNADANLFKLTNQATSKAFEMAVQEIKGGSLAKSNDYPVDILREGKNPLEVKFTRDLVSDEDLLSKLYRYRYDKNSLKRYGFTDDIDIDPSVDIGALDVVQMGEKQKAAFSSWYSKNKSKILKKNTGGKIQRFEGGSPGGIQLGKGRGVAGPRGARSRGDFLGVEQYKQWASSIYNEYDNDPSLVWSSFLGVPMPPEIALYHKMVEDEVFTRGGAGLAVGKKFERTPTENITEELRPYLEPDPSDPSQLGFYKEVIAKFAKQKAASVSQTAKLGKESALAARTSQLAAYSNAENAISDFKKTGSLDLDPSIMGYIKQSIANPDSLPLDSDDIASLKKKLTKPNLDAFAALTGPEAVPVAVQGQRTKLAEVFNSILETYGSDTGDLEIDNIIRGVGSKIMDKKFGGKIQKFMSGSIGGVAESSVDIPSNLKKIIRRIGVIDSDVLGDPSNSNVVSQYMSQLGIGSIADYALYLNQLAAKSRKDGEIKKFRAIAGVAGSGKSTLATTSTTDIATLRETYRKPILKPEDIKNVDEVITITSTVTDKKLDAYLKEVDRAYVLSSTSEAEQSAIEENRLDRDVTGRGLYGRSPGATAGAPKDFTLEETTLRSELGKRAAVLGRQSGSMRLRRKSESELPELIQAQGLYRLAAAPLHRGHEGAVQFLLDKIRTRNPDASLSDILVDIAPNVPMEDSGEGLLHAARYGIFPADFRSLLAQTAIGDTMRSIPIPSRNNEIPRIMEIMGENGRRRFAKLSGAMAVTSEKGSGVLDKYTSRGIDVEDIPRIDDISATKVREAIFSGDDNALMQYLSPEVASVIMGNRTQLRNRSMMVPMLLEQAQKFIANEKAVIDDRINMLLANAPGGPYRNSGSKLVANAPKIAEIINELQIRKRKIPTMALGSMSHQLIAALASKYPDAYGLDVGRQSSVSTPAKDIESEVMLRQIQENMRDVFTPAQLPNAAAALEAANLMFRRNIGEAPQLTEMTELVESIKDVPLSDLITGPGKGPEDRTEWKQTIERIVKEAGLNYSTTSGTIGQGDKTFMLGEGQFTRTIGLKDILTKKLNPKVIQSVGEDNVGKFQIIRQKLSEAYDKKVQKRGPRETGIVLSEALMQAKQKLTELGGPQGIKNVWIDYTKLEGNEQATPLNSFIDSKLTEAGLPAPSPLSNILNQKYLGAGGGQDQLIPVINKIIEETIARRKAIDSQNPYIISEEEKQNATKVSVAGLLSDNDFVRRYFKREKGMVFDISAGAMSPETYSRVIVPLLEGYYKLQREAASRLLPGEPLKDLSREERMTLGSANAEGYDLEVILRLLNAGSFKKTANDAVDFEGGLSPRLAELFGVEPNVYTQAKRTINASSINSALDGIASKIQGDRFMAGGTVGKSAFGTGTFNIPKRITNAYFRELDKRTAIEEFDARAGFALKDTSVRVDELGMRETYDSSSFDLERFKNSFKQKLSRKTLISGMSDFAKLVGLPSESLTDYLPQVVDFDQPSGTVSTAYFDSNPSLNRKAYSLENFGWSEAQEQDLYGIQALVEEKKKEIKRIIKKPVKTFEDGSFSYDYEAAKKADEELQVIKDQLFKLKDAKLNAEKAARANAKSVTETTGRGTIGFNTKLSMFGIGAPGSSLYHELGHQLLNTFRTRVPESFDKYKARVSSLFDGDNDDVAQAIDALPGSNYKSADIAYGRSYKLGALSAQQANLIREQKPENQELLTRAGDIRRAADAVTTAKPFKTLNPVVNSTLGMLGVEESRINKLEDMGKEEFLTTLLQNYPVLNENLNSVLQSTLDELFSAGGVERQRFNSGGLVQFFKKGGYSRSPSKLVPNDPTFDPGSVSTPSKGIDYISILENSGLGLQSWLVDKIAFEAKTNQFSENEVLEYAQRLKEQMSSRPKTNVQNLLETLKEPSRFANGGSVPAMVSNGEAFVPPQVAKKIGYAKLDRMNQADRNGMKGFSGGGISVFKGPGSGTSDSIGPIGLPTGSYVIREKATKALGLNKGGGVGVRKFAAGSPGGVLFDRSVLTTIETALELEAKRLGVSISDLAKELKKTADETRKAALAAGKTKAEANKAAREAAGQKIDLTSLYQSDFGFLEQQIQSRPEKQTRVKAATRDNISGGDILETGQEQRKRIKEEYLATGDVSYAKTGIQKLGNKRPTGRGFTRQEAYDVKALRPDYQASGPGRGGTSTQVKLDLQAEALLAPVRQEIIQRYAKIYDEEKKAINDFYQQKVNKALAAGEEITPIVNEAKAVLAETKAKLTRTAQLEVGGATASAAQTTSAASAQRMEQLKETRARAADPFYDAKKAADASAAGMPGMPKVNEQIRQEQQQFFAYKAEKAGKTVGGFRQDLTKQIGSQAYAIGQERQFAKTEAQTTFAGRARELKGVDVAKATAAGATGEEASKVQGIIEEFAASLRKVDPNLGLGEARKAATKLAEGLAAGDQSVKQIIESNSELQAVFNKTFTETQNLDEAFRRVAEAAGLSEESLRAEISPQKIKEQQFISSKEGQRFGALAEFAPGLTEKFSKTRIGKGLGAGADFISGKGGRLSKAFAGAGGFTGIGAGIAGGAEALKQFLPKSVTSDPNTAGALGALSGAGSGAAMGAQLGSFAGPIGTLIGGVGGAIIGGIQGFFSAKNQAILTNALENVAKTTGDLDQAFKKLESEASAVNLSNAQKAFGDVLAAGQPIEDLAFSKTGFESLGSTFTGGVDKVSAGFAEGDISKIVSGGLQTAFGATGGGLLVDYFSAPSEAQRTEAIGAMVGGAGQRNESAARLAQSGLQFKSTEELGKIFDNIKNGTGELNPITEQYVQGALKAASANGILTKTRKEEITTQAKERAALDAYMKKRKESGATDEQIAKEITKNSDQAKKEGEEALKVQGEIIAKQNLLARTTKEVAIATESLLDVYRRIGAEAQRYSDELDQFSSDVNALVAGLGGDTSTREVNRTNEQVLGNVSAYSMEEVRAAANATAGYLGGTPEAQNLANQAVGQKLVQDQIPALLRASRGDPAAQANALDDIKRLLGEQGIDAAAVNVITEDLATELNKGQGLSEAELQDTVQKAFSTVGKGLEALQNVTKKYNDTLQQARKFQADYNKAVLEAGSYLRKATQVRLNAELDLAKALGRSPTLEELNKPFDVEVASLTSGLVESGDLAAGAASDPAAIAAAITSAEKRKRAIENASPELTAAGANIPAGPAGDPLRQQLNQAQLENIQAVGELTVASAEGRQALEKLANDGTKAANALGKIQEQQQAIEGFADFAQKVFTAEPQELAKMELQAVALNAAQVSGPEFFESRQNRQNAFAGLEQERGFMTKDEYNQTRASLIRKSFEAQGYKGGDVVKNIAGKDITLDELEKRLAGGIDQEDPMVKAYQEAVAVQERANIELGKIYQTQSEILAAAIMDLGKKLTEDFPKIVANASANSQADAQTKPEVKPKEEPRKPSYAETRVSEGQKKIDEGKKLLDEANKERENLGYWAGSQEVGAVNTKERKAREMIAAGQQTVTQFGPEAERNKAFAAMDAALESQRALWAKADEKIKQTEANKVKAQDAIDRAVQTREGGRPVATDGSGRVAAGTVAKPSAQVVIPSQTKVEVAGVPKAPIQAPPAPGAEQPVKDKATRQKEEAKKAAAAEIKNLEPLIADKQKEIAKRENRLKAARTAAIQAGTLKDESGQVVNPNVLGAQSSLDASKDALAFQQAELAKQKQILAEQSKTTEEKQGQVTSQPSPLDAALMTREEQKAAGMPEQPPVDVNKLIAAFEALGFKGTDVVKRLGGEDITLDELKNRLSGSGAEGTTDAEVKSATEGVQTSVAQLQSPLDLVAQMATAALQSGSIYTHDVGLQEGLGILLESMNALGSLASGEPGLAVSDAKVLEALNNLQAPFAALEQMAIASLSEGINTKDATLAAIASVFTPAINQVSAGVSALLAPINAISPVIATALDVIATPIKAIAGAFGVEMSTGQALQTAMGPAGALGSYVAGNAVGAIQNMATPQPQVSDKPITPNRLELANANAANRVVSAPVPVTMPPQASFINQQTTTPPTTPTATEGQLLTIDPTSIEKLNTFNTNFASYVDKLVTFEFPTIPDVIEMRGNHVVDVRISGAAAFEGLKKDFETMMQKEIKKAMGKIWDKTGGAMGASPNS